MPLLYLSIGAMVGMILTLIVVRPKRCKECMEREWVAALKVYLDGDRKGPEPTQRL